MAPIWFIFPATEYRCNIPGLRADDLSRSVGLPPEGMRLGMSNPMTAGKNKRVGSWAIVLSISVQAICVCSMPSVFGNDADEAADLPAPAVKFVVRIAAGSLVVNNVPICWAEATEHIDLDDIDVDDGPASDQIRIDDETLHQLLFDRESKLEAASDILKIDMRVRINDIIRTSELTPVQARKLSLAARGDVRRLFEQRDELRRKYQERRVERDDFVAMRLMARDLRREIEELCRAAQNTLSRDDTMLVKTMRSCLSAEQKNALVNAKVGPASWAADVLDSHRAQKSLGGASTATGSESDIAR